MSKLIKHIIARLKTRVEDYDSPIGVEQGFDWGGQTGCDFSTLEIDWDRLQAEMEAFEAEFRTSTANVISTERK